MRRLVASVVVALVAAATLLAAGGELPADAQAPERRQLEEATARIAELNQEIDAAEAAAEDAETELAEAQRLLREAEAVVNDVAAQVQDQRDAVSDAQRRYDQVVAEAEELEAAFADRVAQIYKQGPTSSFETLLAAEQAEDAVDRSVFLQRISAGDRVDLEALRAARTRVTAERERFEEEQERLEDLLAEEQAFLAEVEELRERRALRAAAAREHLHDLEQEQHDLAEDQERLEELIRREEQAAREREAAERRAEERRAEERRAEQRRSEQQAASESAGSSQPSLSSRTDAGSSSTSGYGWPVCAPITSEYGPRWGRMHEGLDLGAPTGTPIRAAKAGTVIHAGWQGGYGQLVLVSHGDGVVTAYAHMSRIGMRKGASVSKGATIGYIGSTGNSTGPHLHLETRVNGAARNPRQYFSGSPC